MARTSVVIFLRFNYKILTEAQKTKKMTWEIPEGALIRMAV